MIDESLILIWQEGGIYAVISLMFTYMVYSNSKVSEKQAESLEELKVANNGQTTQITEILKETEQLREIVIKLIDRFGRSDAELDKQVDRLIDNAEKRQNYNTAQLNSITDSLNWLRGRTNGKDS